MIYDHQRKLIRLLKGIEEGSSAKEIPIIDDKKVIIGFLKPIDIRLSNDEDIISSLTRWRQKYMRYFLTQFEATNGRTRIWLNNVVIKDDTRILFLIMDETDKAIGNFGICNIDSKSAELDNLIRGEKGGCPKLVLFSEISLISWIYNNLDINDLYLHVFSNNFRTIQLHESVGFRRADIFKLKKNEISDEVKYTKDCSSKPDGEEHGYMRMVLDRDEFYSRHLWMGTEAH